MIRTITRYPKILWVRLSSIIGSFVSAITYLVFAPAGLFGYLAVIAQRRAVVNIKTPGGANQPLSPWCFYVDD